MSALSDRGDLIAVYSGELYHSLALAMLSNSITTKPIGDKVRSATSTLVPPPIILPPYCANVAPAVCW